MFPTLNEDCLGFVEFHSPDTNKVSARVLVCYSIKDNVSASGHPCNNIPGRIPLSAVWVKLLLCIQELADLSSQFSVCSY